MRRTVALSLAGLGLLVVATLASAFTATNNIAGSRADDTTATVSNDSLTPPECAGMTFDQSITGSGIIAGTPLRDLIRGSATADTITGLAEDDCIVGGDGADTIDGGPLGNDVCIGGPGIDTFTECETIVD